jgi:putative transcriptional regulator
VSKKETNNGLGKSLLAAAREARSIARGEADAKAYRIHVPADVDVRKIRRTLGLTQEEFSTRFGLPLGTIRDWGRACAVACNQARAQGSGARALRAEIAEA